jgi:pyocin large subunit-like protein
MPQAIVDPEDLHRFAVELKRFSAEVQIQIASIHRQFGKLGETWKDQEHAKFAGDFQHMITVVAKFVNSAEEQVPILLRKAEAIRRYLERH